MSAAFTICYALGVAAAAPHSSARTTPSRAEQIEIIKANVAVHHALAAIGDHPRMAELRSHIAVAGPIAFEMDGQPLVLHKDRLMIRHGADSLPLRLEQVVELGVTHPDHLETVFDHASLAVAGQSASGGPSALAKARAVVTQAHNTQLELQALIDKPELHPDLVLLADYKASAMFGNNDTKPRLALTTMGAHTLHVDQGPNKKVSLSLYLRGDGDVRDLDAATLMRTGIPSVAFLAPLIARQLVLAAGIEGDPSDPHVMQQARREIARQMPAAAELRQVVRNPRSHPHVALALDLDAAMTSDPARPFVIAQSGPVALAANIHSAFDNKRFIVLVDASTFAPLAPNVWHSDISATWDDLRRVKISSRGEFDAAVEEALVKLYPDLPIAGVPSADTKQK